VGHPPRALIVVETGASRSDESVDHGNAELKERSPHHRNASSLLSHAITSYPD
jgi:hypothetical protein